MKAQWETPLYLPHGFLPRRIGVFRTRFGSPPLKARGRGGRGSLFRGVRPVGFSSSHVEEEAMRQSSCGREAKRELLDPRFASYVQQAGRVSRINSP